MRLGVAGVLANVIQLLAFWTVMDCDSSKYFSILEWTSLGLWLHDHTATMLVTLWPGKNPLCACATIFVVCRVIQVSWTHATTTSAV